MYRGKHTKRAAKRTCKNMAWLVSLVIVLCVSIGGTLAFLTDISDSVTNTFQPSQVTTYVDETIAGSEKTNVKIQNTGDIDAYIRAAVVVTWKNAAGEIAASKPVLGTDYEMVIPGTGWTEIDGYYYWNGKVSPDGYTGILITSCSPVAGKAPDGYSLSVEIIGSGIQSVPTSVVETEWGVTVAADGTISK